MGFCLGFGVFQEILDVLGRSGHFLCSDNVTCDINYDQDKTQK